MATRPSISVSEIDELIKAVLILTRTVDQVVAVRAVESALDEPLSASKVELLRLLHYRGEQTLGRIARYLGVSKPAVTQIADSMVREKLINRTTAKADRRASYVKLTTKGKTMFRAIHSQQRHLIRNALRNSGKGKAEKWLKTLRDMTVSLAQADRAFNRYCLQCGAHADGSCVLVGGDAQCLFLEHIRTSGKKRGTAKA